MRQKKLLFLKGFFPIFLLCSLFLIIPTIRSETKNASRPLPKEVRQAQPIDINDFECGKYLIGAKLKTYTTGEDHLFLYPESDREFSVPLLGLKARESLLYQNVVGFYEIDFPLTEQGGRQGRFYFKKFIRAASLEEIYKKVVKKLETSCHRLK